MKVIESNEDNFKFERAFVIEENGVLKPRAMFGGSICDIETTQAALKAGFAYCSPVDDTPEDSWPISVVVEKETAEGERYQETMWGFTANARILKAARKFDEIAANGTAKEGMEI